MLIFFSLESSKHLEVNNEWNYVGFCMQVINACTAWDAESKSKGFVLNALNFIKGSDGHGGYHTGAAYSSTLQM